MKRSKDILLENSTERQELDAVSLWKCELADAILDTAFLSCISIKVGSKIESQLNTVWVDNATIKINIIKCRCCKIKISSMRVTDISSIKNWKCPHCKKIN